jgi:hypothetical protein
MARPPLHPRYRQPNCVHYRYVDTASWFVWYTTKVGRCTSGSRSGSSTCETHLQDASRPLVQPYDHASHQQSSLHSSKKNVIGGDLQVTVHEYVAPFRIAVFSTIGMARNPRPSAGGHITSNGDTLLASRLMFLRKTGIWGLAPVLRDALGNGSSPCLRYRRPHAMDCYNAGHASVVQLLDIVRHIARTLLHRRKASRAVVVCGRHWRPTTACPKALDQQRHRHPWCCFCDA